MKLSVSLLSLLLFSTTHSRGIEPKTINVERNWSIPESTKVGTIVKSVHVNSESNQTVIYTLELDDLFGQNIENPFWIDPASGYVYLNKSLEGRVSWTSNVGNFSVLSSAFDRNCTVCYKPLLYSHVEIYICPLYMLYPLRVVSLQNFFFSNLTTFDQKLMKV